MTGLSEAYAVSNARGPRLVAALGLFVLGALMVAAGVVAATTEVVTGAGLSVFAARRTAGVLAGLGVPLAFLGVMAVLPTGKQVRAAAVIGASVATFGVVFFWYAYATARWAVDGGVGLRLPVVAIYALGALVTTACLFVGIANVKQRNDPGGTARLSVTETGRVKVVTADSPGLRERLEGATASDGGTSSGVVSGLVDGGRDAEVMSGGAGRQTPTTDGAEVMGETDEPTIEEADRYCGNCVHFEYVRDGNGLQPYCGYDNRTMEDMDACQEWTQRDVPDIE
jgi:hypothetical protein